MATVPSGLISWVKAGVPIATALNGKSQIDKLHQLLRYVREVEKEERDAEKEERDAEKAVFFAQDELVKVRKTADEARRALQDFLKLYQVPES